MTSELRFRGHLDWMLSNTPSALAPLRSSPPGTSVDIWSTTCTCRPDPAPRSAPDSADPHRARAAAGAGSVDVMGFMAIP